MGIDFFQRAVNIQQRYAKHGIKISNSLQTNAVLIDESWAGFLKNENFLVGVSLDGPPELHDIYRQDKNGHPTSEKVLVNANHKLGNIKKDTYTGLLNSCFQKKFGQKKFAGLPNYCRKCEYLKYCYGGCPKDRILSTPEGEQGLNYLCGGYKVFYSYASPIFHKMGASIIY
jgi:radical SAM protein with 4Fe4S-binding SPASM domain